MDEEAGVATSAEVRARARRVAWFLSPLTRALIVFFQAGVGAGLGILSEDAAREGPTDSAVDSAVLMSRVVEVKTAEVSSALIVHAQTRGSTTSTEYDRSGEGSGR